LITYFDTSVLMKLFLTDEAGASVASEVWLASESAVCVEIGYVEVRSALAAASRAKRLSPAQFKEAKRLFEDIWSQLDVVQIDESLVRAAADLAESDGLRGYDAVHFAAALRVDVDTFAAADTALIRAAEKHKLHVAELH
jgi:uncharacterized protein